MQAPTVKTHSDGIWISANREIDIVKQTSQAILDSGFTVLRQDQNNYGYPYQYTRGQQHLDCRFVDSVFLENPNAWTELDFIVTDNIPLRPVRGQLISVVPEFWAIWQFDPVYQDRPARFGYNCFMNRPRGDRSQVFYELIKRNIISHGLVSYNCSSAEYEQQYINNELFAYADEHQCGKALIPYNTVELNGTLEQCIIDSNISLILETYTSDSHIVFSEKVFRALQLPRPWLLYCSPGAVKCLQDHGFDVLEDYIDPAYDKILGHSHRLQAILDQLEQFVHKTYADADYARFAQAAETNQQLLKSFQQTWPEKFNSLLQQLQQL